MVQIKKQSTLICCVTNIDNLLYSRFLVSLDNCPTHPAPSQPPLTLTRALGPQIQRLPKVLAGQLHGTLTSRVFRTKNHYIKLSFTEQIFNVHLACESHFNNSFQEPRNQRPYRVSKNINHAIGNLPHCFSVKEDKERGDQNT